ncbi:hypothetical protein E2P81_ATG11834 [Venturia nashicola]|uniref:Uncharacterized protein n=1 Tax=Venturia nashicola TaxID=86259 RepID=A0A4Z1NKP2_9PEZI|nr:hypothetical protein E6O75_ATG11524 [Venturia nashicola]TLD24498.1 hypothetical protein E2P81_ATG11834 [Venturia nashicola]
MAASTPGPIDLYANNQPTLDLTTEAQTSLNNCLVLAKQLSDNSPIQEWTAALEPLTNVVSERHPSHRSHDDLEFRIPLRPLCFRDMTHRAICLSHDGLAPAQKTMERREADTIAEWTSRFKLTAGGGGLIRSPKGGVINPTVYYESWHCCAVFIANKRLFVYDPHLDLETNPYTDRTQPRSLTTDFSDLSILKEFALFVCNSHIPKFYADEMYIYRNRDKLQQQNTDEGIQLSAEEGRDSLPLCVQWLCKVVKAWLHDPREWLECHLSTDTQRGALPMPNPRFLIPANSTTTPTPDLFDQADWEKIRL